MNMQKGRLASTCVWLQTELQARGTFSLRQPPCLSGVSLGTKMSHRIRSPSPSTLPDHFH